MIHLWQSIYHAKLLNWLKTIQCKLLFVFTLIAELEFQMIAT